MCETAGNSKTPASCSAVLTYGEGRTIPVKQGFLFKRAGHRDPAAHLAPPPKKWREKYVELSRDGVLAYYPSLNAYLEDLHRKEVRLHCVTVKVPGQKPTGLASVVVDEATTTTATTTSSLSTSSSCSSVAGGALSPRSVSAAPPPVLSEFQIVSVNGRTWTFGCETSADRDSWLQVGTHLPSILCTV